MKKEEERVEQIKKAQRSDQRIEGKSMYDIDETY